MLACVDVSYGSGDPRAPRVAPVGATAVPEHATAACLVWSAWGNAMEKRALTARVEDVAPYVPGAFYQRELPCLLEVLRRVEAPLEVVVIDGYVWLSADRRPGLLVARLGLAHLRGAAASRYAGLSAVRREDPVHSNGVGEAEDQFTEISPHERDRMRGVVN